MEAPGADGPMEYHARDYSNCARPLGAPITHYTPHNHSSHGPHFRPRFHSLLLFLLRASSKSVRCRNRAFWRRPPMRPGTCAHASLLCRLRCYRQRRFSMHILAFCRSPIFEISCHFSIFRCRSINSPESCSDERATAKKIGDARQQPRFCCCFFSIRNQKDAHALSAGLHQGYGVARNTHRHRPENANKPQCGQLPWEAAHLHCGWRCLRVKPHCLVLY